MNKRTNLGNTYFENTYIKTTSNAKAKVTWFTKQNGTNCGIFFSFGLVKCNNLSHCSLLKD